MRSQHRRRSRSVDRGKIVLLAKMLLFEQFIPLFRSCSGFENPAMNCGGALERKSMQGAHGGALPT